MAKQLYSIAVTVTGATSVIVEADSIEEARKIYEEEYEGASCGLCNHCSSLAYDLTLGELDAANVDDQIMAIDMADPREVQNANRRLLLWK